MTTTDEKTTWKYDELSDRAKRRAREWWLEGGLGYNWWEDVYEAAARCGIEITEFNLDRGLQADGGFNKSAKQVAQLILENHGDTCDTYNTALTFLAEYVLAELTVPAEDEGWGEVSGPLEALADEFKKNIFRCYAEMLQSEYEYLTSDEAVEEAIHANDYDFDEEGNNL